MLILLSIKAVKGRSSLGFCSRVSSHQFKSLIIWVTKFPTRYRKICPKFQKLKGSAFSPPRIQAGLAISCPFSGEIVPDSYLSPFRCTQTGLDQSTTCLELHHGLLPHLFWLSNNCIIQFLYKSKRNISSCKRRSIELGYLWEWVRNAHLLEWKSLL